MRNEVSECRAVKGGHFVFIFWKAKPYGCCLSVSLEVVRDQSFHVQDLLVLSFLQFMCLVYTHYMPITYTKVFLTSKVSGL